MISFPSSCQWMDIFDSDLSLFLDAVSTGINFTDLDSQIFFVQIKKYTSSLKYSFKLLVYFWLPRSVKLIPVQKGTTGIWNCHFIFKLGKDGWGWGLFICVMCISKLKSSTSEQCSCSSCVPCSCVVCQQAQKTTSWLWPSAMGAQRRYPWRWPSGCHSPSMSAFPWSWKCPRTPALPSWPLTTTPSTLFLATPPLARRPPHQSFTRRRTSLLSHPRITLLGSHWRTLSIWATAHPTP